MTTLNSTRNLEPFREYTGVPERLRAWQAARRIDRAPKREKKPEQQPEPPKLY